ncbi:TetR/AcrR family transcriptional regulator [Kitasatospora sp. NPDC056783]|uniref:TetR/AcrR family transcriptional regulator n=1 Tax=Kitasatospora sp. NPDC056783 TaxID=3345943 RepID=UPI0036C15B21
MAMKRGSYRTGRERVERILDASHELFIGSGYRATSLRDIAAASGISHPALLRHFASKQEILTALVDRLDRRHRDWIAAGADSTGTTPSAAETARRNADARGWIPLFTALLGEATSPEHPGHELMRTRRRVGTRLGVQMLSGSGRDERSALLAVQRFGAAWDGLQILSLYFPGLIDIPAQLDAHEDEMKASGFPPGPALPAFTLPGPAPRPADTANADPPPERTSRARAVEAAARLYARHGYHGTSMQAVAEEAGLTKAALVHVAPTKHALLDLVLAELFAAAEDESDPYSRLRALLDRPRWQAAAEIVLMCEATVPSHPAHAQMAKRLADNLAATADDLAAAQSLGKEEARTSTQWLVALVLGGLIAWLYEPDAIDLEALIGGALPPARRGGPVGVAPSSG